MLTQFFSALPLFLVILINVASDLPMRMVIAWTHGWTCLKNPRLTKQHPLPTMADCTVYPRCSGSLDQSN